MTTGTLLESNPTHADELPVVFDTFESVKQCADVPIDEAFTQRIRDTWGTFIRTHAIPTIDKYVPAEPAAYDLLQQAYVAVKPICASFWNPIGFLDEAGITGIKTEL